MLFRFGGSIINQLLFATKIRNSSNGFSQSGVSCKLEINLLIGFELKVVESQVSSMLAG